MKSQHDTCAQVDSEGRLILPSEIASRYGLKPGDTLPLQEGLHDFTLRRPVSHLKKVYIEPTNQCNLNCRTCIRNIWDEPLGRMTETTYGHLIQSIEAFLPRPDILFGGLGEPLSHPGIISMVQQAKALGSTIEIITNGMLLTETVSRRLIEAGVDVLWVSIDGARPESYADLRLGAALPEVLDNVSRFRDLCHGSQTHIGIVFVAMRRNIEELPDVLRLGRRLGADRFMVTNVLPYTEAMRDEILYADTFCAAPITAPSPLAPFLNFSKMDLNEATVTPLYRVIRGWRVVNFTKTAADSTNNYCPFIEGGSTAVAWDGNLSPCLPLMHNHESYLNDRRRRSQRRIIGNITEHSLKELWDSPDYVSLRRRVKAFDFSPCALCGGCKLSQANEEDCLGNEFPTCGGCLWAQGVIQCP
jgi:MoaA/NifB/PqqE/SkfB family radical SAM enzyme